MHISIRSSKGAKSCLRQAGIIMLRVADRYAYTGCGSTAYSAGTVYGGKRDLYTPKPVPASMLPGPRLWGSSLNDSNPENRLNRASELVDDTANHMADC